MHDLAIIWIRKLQDENADLLQLMSEQRQKYDDTVAKLRSNSWSLRLLTLTYSDQVAVLNAKLQNKMTHRDKVVNTYKAKKVCIFENVVAFWSVLEHQ